VTQTATPTAINARMIRFLSELDVPSDAIEHNRFAERLSQLIDLSGSIKIANAHSNLGQLSAAPADSSALEAKQEFLRVHALIVDGILESFSPSEKLLWAELPGFESLQLTDVNKALKPYLDFYSLHQKQIMAKVKKLRAFVQDAASGVSQQLAQLAKLDAVLDDTLFIHSRSVFSQVSNLLKQRFAPLFYAIQQPQRELSEGASSTTEIQQLHEQLCNDLQALLLAEVEVHLLPVLGLIEAIDEETD
jgi:hypothetical protein